MKKAHNGNQYSLNLWQVHIPYIYYVGARTLLLPLDFVIFYIDIDITNDQGGLL